MSSKGTRFSDVLRHRGSSQRSKDGTDTSQGKVNILLQGYISNAYIEDFALVSDTAYAAQVRRRVDQQPNLIYYPRTAAE